MTYDDWKTTEPYDYESDSYYEDDGFGCCECGGEGYIVNDCFEDTCCCADPELEHGVRTCPACHGRG